ncbi:MAG: OmpA family protein [Lamprobacter sp.]|uniref:OmpA family protein n=1 Tax=Lamprobacter sp. TaxID=3100796 RepID=UPI002B259B1B|nr:OmpA family protein [Lamprobacter sp.]MEA3640291.1 OmpA family protein [Lamprobacter sp.]
MSGSSQSIWKPLFWLLFAAFITVYLLSNHHCQQLQQAIGLKHPTQPSVNRNLDTPTDHLSRALDAAQAEIKALKNSHDALVATKEAAILELQDKLIATIQSRAEVERLLAARHDPPATSDKALANTEASAQAADAIAQASEQVQDFHAPFAALGAQLTDAGLLINLSGDNIRFSSGSAQLPTEAEPILSHIAEILDQHPDLRVQIKGHTDSSGSTDTNLRISAQRAIAVREALIARGIEPERLSTTGLGSTTPVASNDSEAGRQRNRRVELYLLRENQD